MYGIRRKFSSNEIVVNNKSNFKSQLVKCQNIMNNINYDELVIKAMGRATSRAINLALQLNETNYNTFEISPRTYSIEHNEDKVKQPVRGADKDSFDPDDIDINMDKQTIYIPAIELVVRKSKLEIEKVRQVQKRRVTNH